MLGLGFDWVVFELQLHTQSHNSDDALHIHVGLALLFAAALVLRRLP